MSKSRPKQIVVDYARENCTPEFVEGCARRGVEVVYRTPIHKSKEERAMRAAQALSRQAKA
ncbi:hypothetical protein [Polaromonas sp. UC242_47]|uniref:hypothetical protein n=1 Tax=Polaromonas sp. UC242_47 TaxID=3374626 RepID=UPI0037B396A0